MNSPIIEITNTIESRMSELNAFDRFIATARLAAFKTDLVKFSIVRIMRMLIVLLIATGATITGFYFSIGYGAIAAGVSYGYLKTDMNSVKTMTIERTMWFMIELVHILRIVKCEDAHIKEILRDLAAKNQGLFGEIIKVVMNGMDND